MVQLAFEGKVKEAYEIHNKLVDITRLIFAEGNPCGIKVILTEKGIIKKLSETSFGKGFRRSSCKN